MKADTSNYLKIDLDQLSNAEKADIYKTFYNEICQSYHSIDSFRMKLLSFLPLFSVVGILFIDNTAEQGGKEVIAFAGIFAALFTIALFVYEVRGIIRSDNLIKKGKLIEGFLGISGQFCVCSDEQQKQENEMGEKASLMFRLRRRFNAKLAASLMYSLVFSAWLYISLKYSANIQTQFCVMIAAGLGIIISIFAYRVIRSLLAA